jgi:hypothetical protein
MPHTRKPSPRILCALGLAGALIALTAIIGFHELEHLQGRARDSRDCPVCVWNHGTTAGTTETVCLVWTLLPIGQLVPDIQVPLRNLFIHSTPSRAPPGIA